MQNEDEKRPRADVPCDEKPRRLADIDAEPQSDVGGDQSGRSIRSRGLWAKVLQNPVDAFATGPPAVGEDGDLGDGRVALSVFGAEGGFGMRKPLGLEWGAQALGRVKPPDRAALIAPAPRCYHPERSEA